MGHTSKPNSLSSSLPPSNKLKTSLLHSEGSGSGSSSNPNANINQSHSLPPATVLLYPPQEQEQQPRAITSTDLVTATTATVSSEEITQTTNLNQTAMSQNSQGLFGAQINISRASTADNNVTTTTTTLSTPTP